METIMVLAVFFILVVVSFVFYSKFSEMGAEIKKEENMQLNAIKIAQRASSLPELQCSQENIVAGNCVNKLNLEALSGAINENEIHYFDMFSFSRITVNEIYPDENKWVLYDRPLDDFSYKIAVNMPISISYPIENKNAFGVMVVEVFSK